ncbi:MAG TPA: SDR family oxidoreductase, partial [Tepidisphaeraceae bacterium]|nr:SDR family oxidoreductase [Tepidisphaeraceae bacterium]
MSDIPLPTLKGQKALVLGIANEHSIAYGCARAFHRLGAELGMSYFNDKARPYVEPLARELEASIFERLDVQQPGQLEAVFDRVRQTWGRLDIALHAIASAPKEDLRGGLLNCSAAGFSLAMDVSCHSFVRMAALASPLMTEGGHASDPDISRGRQSGLQLCRHGAREGGARGNRAVLGLRVGAEAYPRACDFGGADQDSGLIRA